MSTITASAVVRFTVVGLPQPAGSKRAFPFKKKSGGLGVAVSDANPKAKSWQHAVASACPTVGELLTGPLQLTVWFFMPRPQGHYRTGARAAELKESAPSRHTTRPDATKLLRGVEDALSGVLWRDDSQVVQQTVFKDYGSPARAEIYVEQLPS